MQTLVIGGTGFIGEYLCRELLSRGESEIIVVSMPGLKEEEKIHGVQYEEIDLNTNFLELKKIMKEVDKIIFAIQPDIERMQNILSVIKEFGNIKKIIYLSTLLVYPDSIEKQNEDVIPEPNTDYEKVKYEEEKLMVEFVEDRDCQLSIARLGNVYGDVKNRGVVNNILLALIKNEDFYLDGDGQNLRDYVFVEDVVRLLVGLTKINNTLQVERFNICTGKGHSILEVINLLEGIVGKKLKVLSSNKSGRSKSVIGDNKKSVEMVKLTPQYSLTEGLVKTYNNYSKLTKILQN